MPDPSSMRSVPRGPFSLLALKPSHLSSPRLSSTLCRASTVPVMYVPNVRGVHLILRSVLPITEVALPEKQSMTSPKGDAKTPSFSHLSKYSLSRNA